MAAIDRHKEVERSGNSVIAAETIAQTDAEIIHVDAAKLCCCCCCCCCCWKVMLLLLLKSYVAATASGK